MEFEKGTCGVSMVEVELCDLSLEDVNREIRRPIRTTTCPKCGGYVVSKGETWFCKSCHRYTLKNMEARAKAAVKAGVACIRCGHKYPNSDGFRWRCPVCGRTWRKGGETWGKKQIVGKDDS